MRNTIILALAILAAGALVRAHADQLPTPLAQGLGGPALYLPLSTIANIGTTCSGLHKGQMYMVTDSTAIASDYQTCAGSGSTVAVATCNGTNWICSG